MTKVFFHDNAKWNFREILLLLIVTFIQIQNGQIVALLCAAFFSVSGIFSKRNTRYRIPVVLLIWFFSVTLMIVTTYKFSPETWIEIIWLFTGIGVIFGATVNTKVINHKTEIIVLPTVILCVANILYYFELADFSSMFLPAYAGTRVQGGFDGPNEIGAFVVVVLTYMWMQNIYRNKVRFVLIYSTIMMCVVVLTWSRGAFLCVGLLICFVLIVRIKKAPVRRKISMLITAVIAVIMLVMVVKDYVLPEFNYIRRAAGGRDGILSYVIYSFNDSPIFGLGLDPFSNYGISKVPHSTYYFMIMAGGLIGLTALLYLYINFLRVAFKKRMMPEFFTLMCYYVFEQGFNNLIRGRVLFLFLIIVIFIYAPESKKQLTKDGDRNEVNKVLS